jgi:hypothetical protein
VRGAAAGGEGAKAARRSSGGHRGGRRGSLGRDGLGGCLNGGDGRGSGDDDLGGGLDSSGYLSLGGGADRGDEGRSSSGGGGGDGGGGSLLNGNGGRGGGGGGGRGSSRSGGGRSGSSSSGGAGAASGTADAGTGKGHGAGGGGRAAVGDGLGQVPGHADVGPADAAVGEGDHVARDVDVGLDERLADLGAVSDELEAGAGESALAAHGDELAVGVRDLLPGDEDAGAVKGGDVGVGAVVGAGGDPVDLRVAVGGANDGAGLVADEGVLVRELSNGDVAAVGAVGAGGVAVAHPRVGGQVNGTAGDPGRDVGVAVNEADETAVGAAHSAKGLTTAAVGGVLVGDLDTAHALGSRVEPDVSLVLGAHAGEGSGIGSLKEDTSVVRASPGAGSARDGGQSSGISNVLDAVSIVSRCVTSVTDQID